MQHSDEIRKAFTTINDKINVLNKQLASKRFPFITPIRITIGVAFVGISTYYCFRKQINSTIATEGGKIAGDIVKSDDVKNSIDEFLKHPETKKIFTETTKDWLTHVSTQRMLTESSHQWLTQQDTQDMLTDTTKIWLSQDKTKNMLADAFIELCNRDDVKNTLVTLTKDILVGSFGPLKYIISTNKK